MELGHHESGEGVKAGELVDPRLLLLVAGAERVELLARVVDQLLMDLYAVVQRVGPGELGDERREVCEMGP